MKIFIIHGYLGSVDKHWFPWLSQELVHYGHNVKIIELPSPENPTRVKWVNTLTATIGLPDQNTVVITHSLGGYTFLKYLTELPEAWNLGGLVLVSGFQGQLASLPDLDEFLNEAIDQESLVSLAKNIKNSTVIYSDEDQYVSPVASQNLADQLGAEHLQIFGGGHFLDEEGFTSFPELLTLVQRFSSPPQVPA